MSYANGTVKFADVDTALSHMAKLEQIVIPLADALATMRSAVTDLESLGNSLSAVKEVVETTAREAEEAAQFVQDEIRPMRQYVERVSATTNVNIGFDA